LRMNRESRPAAAFVSIGKIAAGAAGARGSL
jgi:hypothetical protein